MCPMSVCSREETTDRKHEQSLEVEEEESNCGATTEMDGEKHSGKGATTTVDGKRAMSIRDRVSGNARTTCVCVVLQNVLQRKSEKTVGTMPCGMESFILRTGSRRRACWPAQSRLNIPLQARRFSGEARGRLNQSIVLLVPPKGSCQSFCHDRRQDGVTARKIEKTPNTPVAPIKTVRAGRAGRAKPHREVRSVIPISNATEQRANRAKFRRQRKPDIYDNRINKTPR